MKRSTTIRVLNFDDRESPVIVSVIFNENWLLHRENILFFIWVFFIVTLGSLSNKHREMFSCAVLPRRTATRFFRASRCFETKFLWNKRPDRVPKSWNNLFLCEIESNSESKKKEKISSTLSLKYLLKILSLRRKVSIDSNFNRGNNKTKRKFLSRKRFFRWFAKFDGDEFAERVEPLRREYFR